MASRQARPADGAGTRQFSVTLPERIVEKLDHIADRRGVSRAAVVAEATLDLLRKDAAMRRDLVSNVCV